MSPDPDDDALRWEGDDDPTLAPGWKVVGGVTRAPVTGAVDAPGETDASAETGVAGETDASGGADASDGASSTNEPDGPRQAGSVELIVLGILGGVYLLYSVGWLITALRGTPPGFSVLGDIMFTLGLWLAVAAPALWFAVASVAVRRPPLRLVWLAIGVLVLVPLPFVLGVAA